MTSDSIPEVSSAVDFLTQLVKQRSRGMARSFLPCPETLSELSTALRGVLAAHYADHWFPGQPWRGGAYRCIRINGKMDPLIAKAGLACGVDPDRLRAFFPPELTVWIDPGNVSYRIGEEGSVCELYSGTGGGPTSPGAASSLATAKSLPVMSGAAGGSSYPSPAPSPASYTSGSSSGAGSQRSSPMPVLFSEGGGCSSTSSCGSGSSSFGYTPSPHPAGPTGGFQGSTNVVESLASLVMISSDPFGSPQRDMRHRMPNMPQGGASPYAGGPPLTGSRASVFQQQSGGAQQQLIFNDQARGCPGSGGAPWPGYFPAAGSGSGVNGSHPGVPPSHANAVCKDNLERLVECMAPLCIASMGSA